jgi:hypothetical protein
MFFEPIKEPIVGARPPSFDRHVLVSLVETLGFLANSATKHTLAPGGAVRDGRVWSDRFTHYCEPVEGVMNASGSGNPAALCFSGAMRRP